MVRHDGRGSSSRAARAGSDRRRARRLTGRRPRLDPRHLRLRRSERARSAARRRSRRQRLRRSRRGRRSSRRRRGAAALRAAGRRRCNAGHRRSGPHALELDVGPLRRVLDVNVVGAFSCSRRRARYGRGLGDRRERLGQRTSAGGRLLDYNARRRARPMVASAASRSTSPAGASRFRAILPGYVPTRMTEPYLETGDDRAKLVGGHPVRALSARRRRSRGSSPTCLARGRRT